LIAVTLDRAEVVGNFNPGEGIRSVDGGRDDGPVDAFWAFIVHK